MSTPFWKSRQSLNTTSLPWFFWDTSSPTLTFHGILQERTLLSGPWMAFPLICKYPPCIRNWKKRISSRSKPTHFLVSFSIKHICPFSVRRLDIVGFVPQVTNLKFLLALKIPQYSITFFKKPHLFYILRPFRHCRVGDAGLGVLQKPVPFYVLPMLRVVWHFFQDQRQTGIS